MESFLDSLHDEAVPEERGLFPQLPPLGNRAESIDLLDALCDEPRCDTLPEACEAAGEVKHLIK